MNTEMTTTMDLEEQIFQLCAIKDETSRRVCNGIFSMIMRNCNAMRIETDYRGNIGDALSIIVLSKKRDTMATICDMLELVKVKTNTFMMISMMDIPHICFYITFTFIHPGTLNAYMKCNEVNLVKIDENHAHRYDLNPSVRRFGSIIDEDIKKLAFHPILIQKWISGGNDCAIEDYNPLFILPSTATI